MKLLLIFVFIIFNINLNAQYVADAHTMIYQYYSTVKTDLPSTLLWLDTTFDSVLLDGNVIVYKQSPYKHLSSFWIMLDSLKKVYTYNELYSNDTTVNSKVKTYTDILNTKEGHYVSFYYYGNDLWLNDSIIFKDDISGVFVCIVKFSKPGKLISLWRYSVPSPLAEVWVKPLPGGKMVMGGTTSYYTIQLGSFTLPCIGCHVHDVDAYVAIIDSQGAVINAKRFGSDIVDNCQAIVTTPAGDIYMAGSYYGSPFRIDSFAMANNGYTSLTSDAYLVKLNEKLEAQWLQRIWGSGVENSQGLEQDEQGNLYWAVNYSSAQVHIGDTTLTGDKANGLLAKIDPDGKLLWVQNIVSDGTLDIRNISADAGGNTWLNVNFKGNLLTSYQAIQGQGGNDNLLVQFGSDGQPYRQLIMGGAEDESVYAIQAVPDGRLLLQGTFTSDTLDLLNLRLPADRGGNSYTNFFATVQFPAVSTTELSLSAAAIRMFPNPVRSNQPVWVQSDENWGKGQISVFNCLGHLIGQFETDPSSQSLFIPGGYFRPGIYFLRYQTAEAERSKVLVVTP